MPVHFIQSPGTVIQRPADFHLDRACRNAVSGSDDRMPFTPQTRRNQDFALPIGQLAQDQGKRAKLIAIFGLSGGVRPLIRDGQNIGDLGCAKLAHNAGLMAATCFVGSSVSFAALVTVPPTKRCSRPDA